MFISLVWKTALLYFVVVLSMRLMGKRQIGQLQPFEFAIAVMISELAAFPLTEENKNIIEGIIPIFILVVCQFVISFISIKSVRAREIICGRPRVVIKNGTIQEKNLRKELYTINDLLEQLRIANVQDISDVEVGVLETNGELSMVLKSQKRPVTPADLGISTDYEGPSLDIIIDGVVRNENLKLAKLDTNWLMEQLKNRGWNSPKDIFFASLNSKGELYVQPKWKVVKNRKC
ncbi:MAG: DUF421 domain-containing protein [Clostridiaceae bacterium]|nr:DUF421 domain-containing protein [Clostridiaceae bacterium]